MKGDSKVNIHLNTVLGNELIAINQYFLHARIYLNWGFEELNEHVYKASIKAMKHADKLTQRVLFLEGFPNLQDLGRLHIGEDPEEMIQGDLTLEMTCRINLKEAIAYFEEAADYVSRELLEDILTAKEEHIDWLETQLSLVNAVGRQNYLQSVI